MAKRVVITGLGTVNPLGNNVKDYWERVKAGENGITRITRFDPSEHTSQVAGEVKDFNAGDFFDAKEARRMDRFTVYAVAAAVQAHEDAGLKNGDIDPDQIGIVLGNGIGGIEVFVAVEQVVGDVAWMEVAAPAGGGDRLGVEALQPRHVGLIPSDLAGANQDPACSRVTGRLGLVGASPGIPGWTSFRK